MLRRPAVATVTIAAFAAWTVFVWGVRVANVLGDDAAAGEARVADLAKAGVFVVAGLAVAAALAVARRRPGEAWPLQPAVRGLAVLTVVVWAVDGTDVVTGGHGAVFVAVHLALAAASIGLAVAAVAAQSHLRRRNTTTSAMVSTTISPSANG